MKYLLNHEIKYPHNFLYSHSRFFIEHCLVGKGFYGSTSNKKLTLLTVTY